MHKCLSIVLSTIKRRHGQKDTFIKKKSLCKLFTFKISFCGPSFDDRHVNNGKEVQSRFPFKCRLFVSKFKTHPKCVFCVFIIQTIVSRKFLTQSILSFHTTYWCSWQLTLCVKFYINVKFAVCIIVFQSCQFSGLLKKWWKIFIFYMFEYISFNSEFITVMKHNHRIATLTLFSNGLVYHI